MSMSRTIEGIRGATSRRPNDERDAPGASMSSGRSAVGPVGFRPARQTCICFGAGALAWGPTVAAQGSLWRHDLRPRRCRPLRHLPGQLNEAGQTRSSGESLRRTKRIVDRGPRRSADHDGRRSGTSRERTRQWCVRHRYLEAGSNFFFASGRGGARVHRNATAAEVRRDHAIGQW